MLYRYVDELDDNGSAMFFYEVSTKGKYYVKAEYYNIVGYDESTSPNKNFEVI